ncbi:hypothetical protein HK101_009740 [Irineochytrium annulatum]|nr:hypothetical protein HK101_009740 [Irineochytrium annulatum]
MDDEDERDPAAAELDDEDDDSDDSGDEDDTPPRPDMLENEAILKELNTIEKAIIYLLEKGAAAIEALAYDGIDEDSAIESFDNNYTAYLDTLKVCQAAVGNLTLSRHQNVHLNFRGVFRSLTDAGILSSSTLRAGLGAHAGPTITPLPYGLTSDGEEKDFELAAQSVLVLKERMRAGVFAVTGVDIRDSATADGRGKEEPGMSEAMDLDKEISHAQ